MNILSFIRPSLLLYVVQIEKKKTYVTNVYNTPHICNCSILNFGYAFFLLRLLETPKFEPGQHRSSRFEFQSFKKPLLNDQAAAIATTRSLAALCHSFKPPTCSSCTQDYRHPVKFKIQAQVTAWKIQIRFDQVDTPWTLLQLVLNVDLSLALKRNQHIQFYLSSIIKLRISKY